MVMKRQDPAMSNTKLSKRLEEQFFDTILPALYSPYSIGLQAGTLPFEKFCKSISCEALFLEEFGEWLQMAEEHVTNVFHVFSLKNLRKSMCRYACSRAQIAGDMGEFTTTSLHTRTKMSELLHSSEHGNAKELTPSFVLAIIASCFRLYADIYSTVAWNTAHIFNRWFDMNSLKTTMLEIENTFDELNFSLTREDSIKVEDFYQQALKLVAEFFATLPISEESSVPLYSALNRLNVKLVFFYCNFDLTCSLDDSISILEELATSNLSEPKFDEVFPNWQNRARSYVDKEKICMRSMQNGSPAPTFDYEGICNALEQFAKFEMEANTTVVDSQLLKGLDLDDIKRAGQSCLQDECKRFFQKIAQNASPKIDIHISSYSWCGDLIRSAFSPDLHVSVHSNELVYEESITTGDISRKVESPMEKCEYFASVKARTEGDNFTIYIGRRAGDLLCLLEANIGIIIDKDSLGPLCNHFAIQLKPLHSSVVENQNQLSLGLPHCWKPLSGILYFVDSWAEIEAFILGL